MKASVTILALAASLGEVSATWKHAKPYTRPGNAPNECSEHQKGGFNWGDLNPGKFDKYKDFDFKGWSCEDKSGGKTIKSECGDNKDDAPSFESSKDFSVDFFDFIPEFDGDFVFDFEMPDGSSCKQRSFCSKQGSSVKNKQCGGSKKVHIIYPPQKDRPDGKCKIELPEIGFDCDKHEPPEPPKEEPPKEEPPKEDEDEYVPPVEEQPPSSFVTHVSSAIPEPSAEVPDVPAVPSVDLPEVPVESVPVEIPDVEIPDVEIPVESSPVEVPDVEIPDVEIPVESAPVEIPISEPVVDTTTYQTISTIYTTSVSTITDCGPEVPECGGAETPVVVTVTVPETTTVCDVTDTITHGVPPPSDAPEVPVDEDKPEEGDDEEVPVDEDKPEEGDDEEVPVEDGDKPEEDGSDEPPAELDCPDVVPRCLASWIDTVGCIDNTDSNCFCPDTEFIENIFNCVYAHGEDDTIISKAIDYVQGICADSVPENPAIVTCAKPVKEYLDVPEPTPVEGEDSPAVTEIVYDDITVKVPKVHFTSSADDVVPVAPAPTPEPVEEGEDVVEEPAEEGEDSYPAPPAPEDESPEAEYPEGEPLPEGEEPNPVEESAPIGTGELLPEESEAIPVEAGAGKIGSTGVGAAIAVMVAVAAF